MFTLYIVTNSAFKVNSSHCMKQERYTNTEYLSGQNQNFNSNVSTWLSSVVLQQEAGVPELLKCSLLLSQMYYHLELHK